MVKSPAGGRAGVQHHGAGAMRARDGAPGREYVAGARRNGQSDVRP